MYDSIRTATAADAADFAYVLCESWKAAYRDILTPERLADQTDLARRTAFFERLLPDPGCFLARDGGNPCGICSVSPERSGELPGWGELVSLYTLPAYWGSGLGRALMDRALDALAAAGYANVCLWAFEANGRACCFYEKCGFTRDGARKHSRFADVPEIRFVRKNVLA